jgi:hypothetical protein
MGKRLHRPSFFILLLLAGLIARAQDSAAAAKPAMADALRSSGKIYVVVVVLIVILLGLFLYMIRLDRKIGSLEKNRK